MEVTARKTDSANVSVEAKIAKSDIDKRLRRSPNRRRSR
ncbi:hypothetical protein NNO_0087 [Hydrogenimonas sp.]|nr:hypothetical protein NNO_0087 [Hydrogenimonas sp.]